MAAWKLPPYGYVEAGGWPDPEKTFGAFGKSDSHAGLQRDFDRGERDDAQTLVAARLAGQPGGEDRQRQEDESAQSHRSPPDIRPGR